VLVLYVPKLFISAFLMTEDLTRAVRWGWYRFSPPEPTVQASSTVRIGRAEFLSQAALLVAAVPFGGLLYGALRGKYRYTVRKITVRLPNLPEAFHGTTLTQISDIHAGTFDNVAELRRGVEMINAQQSDYIVFTGDLVNNHVDEMYPYRELFGSLRAHHGVFSILGNHDYGTYAPYPTPEEGASHRERMLALHREMGWDLLLNEHRVLEKDGQQIALVGIENWGTSFSKYGRLEDAMRGTESYPVKILLSHDPTHWDAQVRPQHPEVDLMLSGHTHGMQMGFEIPGFSWSPAQWRYKQWAGLYREGEQYLYVNRGFGFLGYSGRAGIWPEIAVITLEKA
jgi:predicted MPP superfamily phosphohydrolase